MKIFVPKEINREKRVAASPDTVKKFVGLCDIPLYLNLEQAISLLLAIAIAASEAGASY